MNKYDNIYDNKNDNNKYNYSNNSSNININNNYYTDDNMKENNLEDSNNDDSSALNYTDDENVDPENNLSVIRTFIRNIIDDNIINNIKYIHYFIYCFTKFSQILFFILRKFGYFLVILTLLTCGLSIYFYPMIVRTLRCIIFLCGFVILTYNFKPMNIVYRFISCFHEYYYLERKRRRTKTKIIQLDIKMYMFVIHYDFEKNRYILLIRNKNAYKNLTFLILLYVYNHIIIL
ncbi:hypothetical protein PFLG_01315 [Plasmodium falciparum RAJ116]|uniref:Uncharacterized protein n=1 Tax=Plasmodium falciparum RAJ116 TaxID=580058 RepID=A0A0L0CYP8_PLAFA|nr:hypothetical protein PFLG_01315 [Plasmodium falciparum RAJ116]